MKTENSKKGVCIVGCGFMGNIHAEAWQKQAEFQIVAVVDIMEQRAELLAQKLGLSGWFTDFYKAIALPEVDVVSICIPTNLHAEASIYSAENKKHILCEKPIALNIQDALAMQKAAQSNKVSLGVAFMRRHSPVLDQLRNFINSGELGHPVLYCSSDIRQIRPKLAMHDVDQNGGPIIDMGVHLFDSWNFIFDSPIANVSAQAIALAAKRLELSTINHIAPDTATITVKHESGDIGNFIVSWGLPPGVNPPQRPDQIFGPNGILEVVFEMSYQYLKWKKDDNEWQTLAESYENMYEIEITNFANHLLAGRPFPTMAGEGIAALEIALSASRQVK
jgi:predicted dehydrogenase